MNICVPHAVQIGRSSREIMAPVNNDDKRPADLLRTASDEDDVDGKARGS